MLGRFIFRTLCLRNSSSDLVHNRCEVRIVVKIFGIRFLIQSALLEYVTSTFRRLNWRQFWVILTAFFGFSASLNLHTSQHVLNFWIVKALHKTIHNFFIFLPLLQFAIYPESFLLQPILPSVAAGSKLFAFNPIPIVLSPICP